MTIIYSTRYVVRVFLFMYQCMSDSLPLKCMKEIEPKKNCAVKCVAELVSSPACYIHYRCNPSQLCKLGLGTRIWPNFYYEVKI